MSCCLNPNCQKPLNPDTTQFCQSCGSKITLLRNRYYIIKPLGSGGFGRTYLAQDQDKLDEKCAIKQLTPQTQGSWAIQKAQTLFAQEARQLHRLGQHPQIPHLLAYFEEDNFLYLVQEYIPGLSLEQEFQQQGNLSQAQIEDLLIELLTVLKFVHQQDIIHRDIKPENIIRRHSDKKLVLIDFGVSKQLTQSVVNQPGTTIGSLGYAPLEQMEGANVSPASDLHSLGVTCFQLLTGANPTQLWTKQGYGWVSNWRQYLTSGIGEEFAQILDRLLQVESNQRYQSADEVLRDVSLLPTTLKHNVSQTTPTVATPYPVYAPTQAIPGAASPPPPAKSKKIWLITGAILLLATVSYGVGRFLVSRSHSYEKMHLATTLAQHKSRVTSLDLSTDGKMLISGSEDKTVKIWHLRQTETAIDLTSVRSLNRHTDAVYSLNLSADGKILASSGADDTITLWRLPTVGLINILRGHASDIFSLAISPDSKTLASGSSDKTIKLWQLPVGELQTKLTGHEGWVRALVISPDSKTLVSGSEDQTIRIWDLSTRELKQTLTEHLGAVRALAISPDGKTLISGSSDKTIKIWDLTTGKLKNTLKGHDDYVLAVAISDNGKIFVSGSEDGTIKVWNLQTGELQTTLEGNGSGIYAVAVSSASNIVVGGNSNGAIEVWQLPQ